jgi:hypothetical protein
MTRDQITSVQSWYNDYVSRFFTHGQDQETDWAIQIKQHHSERVREEIALLSAQLCLTEEDTMTAEVLALIHDVGRFSQYKEYGTFRDDLSVNHATLGAEEIAKAGILDDFTTTEQEFIRKGILYHNMHTLPKDENLRSLFFCKLLRDADKLDIWRFLIEHYRNGHDHNGQAALEVGFQDTPGYSKTILDDLISAKTPNSFKIKNLNDYKLLQLSWVYDVNFSPTFREIKKREYIETLASTLPLTQQLRKILTAVHDYIAMKAIPQSHEGHGRQTARDLHEGLIP